jgi:hypothetical protein
MKLEENRPQGPGFFSPGESLGSSFAVFFFIFLFFFLEKFVLAFLDFKTMGKMETGQARLYLEGLYFFLALVDGLRACGGWGKFWQDG